MKYLISIITATFPMIAFADTGKTLHGLIVSFIGYLNDAIILLMAFAVVSFVWYVVKYFIRANDNRTEAAQYVMWSLIGFFVIFSIWGLVNILISTFDLGNGSPATWTSMKDLFPR